MIFLYLSNFDICMEKLYKFGLYIPWRFDIAYKKNSSSCEFCCGKI